MNTIQPTPNTPWPSPRDPNHKDEWEDWEDSDEEGHVAVDDKHGLLIDLSDEAARKGSRLGTTQSAPRNLIRHSVQKPVRVKSKARQKAQNAKAGIKLVTDMSKFRQPAQRPKFVDAVALQALEGEPSSASIGSFSWLKQRPGQGGGPKLNHKLVQAPSSDLSPVARPIVIGIAVPSDNLSDHQVSPHTAVLETPTDYPRSTPKPTTGILPTVTPHQLRSVWSPDTEASESPYPASKTASSVYSQPSMYGGARTDTDVPPVPALPTTVKSKERQTVVVADLDDDDDLGTPCTLFEEDGSPTMTRKSVKPKTMVVSPGSASSRSHGWWDHVTTPFIQQQTNPFKQQTQDTGSSSSPQQWNPFKKQTQEPGPSSSPAAVPHQWWAGADEEGGSSQSNSPSQQKKGVAPSSSPSTTGVREWWSGTDEKGGSSLNAPGQASNPPTVSQQQYTAQSVVPSPRPTSPGRSETQSEKAKILLEENQAPTEQPPPYSPSKPVNQVKYGVILPPPVVINSQRVPSPGPVTPGLTGTMTSQGAIRMADIPLTPNAHGPVQAAVLPDRAPGSYVPGDHFYQVRGQANRTERQRRRHEKEEVVARKVGGFWRGRGCMPKSGCFGRSGREGRKRRRVWLCVIAAIIAAIILAVLLAVFLTRRPPPQAEPVQSIWLNLTDFPPMPTGVLTVSGPDNSLDRTGCFTGTADTAWSCSLPKEEHDSVAPNAPNQPEFIFQIQYDNDTRAIWNITDNDTTSNGKQTTLFDTGFNPNPLPPSLAEISFLGNTTDHIQADNKAGEPTPFFISMLTDVNKTVGPNMLTRRQGANNAIGGGDDGFNLTEILPPPVLNGDGTGAPAQMFPHPVQQPVRLFDRGLPTEHYSFYTYFDKSIYMVNTVGENAADQDGGALETAAKSLVTLAQTRFLVQIWTRMENSTQLLGGSNAAVPWTNGSAAADTPGTMPYPVTVTEDMHGGDKEKKIDYLYGVLPNQAINTTDAKLVIVNRAFAGTLVNGINNNPNLSLGGIDGGTGGCKCEWINFKALNKVTT
ncbi:hypothetical protein F4804DRAFT_299972 [Jackrogersella minutella]|nr:hypothetical protein F4804DRAFT_299972 [Jackrogersella minutella]